MCRLHTTMAIVPSGCTSLQPLYISINKPFKHRVKDIADQHSGKNSNKWTPGKVLSFKGINSRLTRIQQSILLQTAVYLSLNGLVTLGNCSARISRSLLFGHFENVPCELHLMAVEIVTLVLEDWRDIQLVPRVQTVRILVHTLMVSMSLGRIR